MASQVQRRSAASGIRTAVVGVLAVGLALSVVVGWSAVELRRAAGLDAAANLTQMASTLSREVSRVINTQDVALRFALRAVEAPAFKMLDPASRDRLLCDHPAQTNTTTACRIVDAQGRVVYDSAGPAVALGDVADQPFFLAHKRGEVTGLFISTPQQSRRTHDWSLTLSRRISNPDGSFGGVVAGVVRYADLARLFASADPPPGVRFALYQSDGTLLYPEATGEAALQPDGTAVLRHLQNGATQRSSTVFQPARKKVLIAASRVDDLPLAASVNMPLSQIYAQWLAETILMGVMSAVLLLTGALLLRAMSRQQRNLLQAERREREQSELARQVADRHHSGKMEVVGRLTAGVAHDFNNYLQTITSSLEIISADYLHEPEAKEIAQIAHKAANNGAKLTHRLLTFSRQQVLQPRRVNVAFLLSDLRKLIADSHIFSAEIRCEIAVEPFTDDLHVDATQVESCLLNLLLNARDAMPHGGTLHLKGRNANHEDALFGGLTPRRHVILTVADDGRGMDEATRAQAFEPFFTTKAFGSGSGLGLSMAQGFCHQSGGDIRILERPNQPGTTVELWFPAADPDLPPDEEVEFNYATIGRRTGRLLLVEDERDVLMTLSAILISGGFEVVSVNNGTEGLMRLHDREPYDAVLTDYSMPDMTGSEFLARAAADMPNLPMLILSGGEVSDLARAALPRTVRVLRKPIRRMGLLNAVREAIGENSRQLVT